MTVDESAAVTRNMLDHTHDPSGCHAVEHSPAKRRDLHRFRAEGAIADDVAGALLADVEQGKAVHVDPARPQHQPERSRVGARRFDRRRRRCLIQPREILGGGERRPFRRLHPRDAPALLIDQDRQIAAAAEVAQRIREPKQLLRVAAIALEQDEGRRIGVTEEAPLSIRQLQPSGGVDRGLHQSRSTARRSSFRRPP